MKDMFVKGLIDAAATYGDRVQSCAGGTYNKLFESLAGLHPSAVITLDKMEARAMIKKQLWDKYSWYGKGRPREFVPRGTKQGSR